MRSCCPCLTRQYVLQPACLPHQCCPPCFSPPCTLVSLGPARPLWLCLCARRGLHWLYWLLQPGQQPCCAAWMHSLQLVDARQQLLPVWHGWPACVHPAPLDQVYIVLGHTAAGSSRAVNVRPGVSEYGRAHGPHVDWWDVAAPLATDTGRCVHVLDSKAAESLAGCSAAMQ